MADFKYLLAGATPSVTFWVISMIIGLAVSIGLTVFFNQEDFFGDENRRPWE
jgi:ABC-type arginine/histidine transport system permease subunit